MASTSDIRKGLCIKYNHDIYKVIEFLHVKPGKGPAFVRTKLKSVTSGKVVDNTFSAGHKIDDVRVETRSYQYLYAEGDTFHFMNTDDYNQISLQKSSLDAPDLLKEGESIASIRNSDRKKNLVIVGTTDCEIKLKINGIKMHSGSRKIKLDNSMAQLRPNSMKIRGKSR